jgi:hypothetical protein
MDGQLVAILYLNVCYYSLFIFTLQELVLLMSTPPKPGRLVCSAGTIF